MPTRAFAITADDKPIPLANSPSAEVSITVANASGKPVRGQARAIPLGNTKAAWLAIGGEVERNFAVNEAHQFVVRFSVPAGTPAGKYSTRLNVVSVQNPDDEYAEGPVVSFIVPEPPAPPPVQPKRSPWLFWLILALVIIGGLVTTYFILRPKPEFSFAPAKPFIGQQIEFRILTVGKFSDVRWEFSEGHADFTANPVVPALTAIDRNKLQGAQQLRSQRPDLASMEATRAAPPSPDRATAPPPKNESATSPATATASDKAVHTFFDAGPHPVTLVLRKNGIDFRSTQIVNVRPAPITIPAANLSPRSQQVGVGNSMYGPGVIFNLASGDNNVADYDVTVAGTVPLEFRVEIDYSAADPRPVVLAVNGIDIVKTALPEATGGWMPENRRTAKVGVVTLQPGANRLTLSRKGAIPHLKEIRLIPSSDK